MKKCIFTIIAAFAAAIPVLAQQKSSQEDNSWKAFGVQKDSLISFPWGQTRTYWQATGNVYTVTEEDLDKRAMGDLRNRFTGMVPGMEVVENGGSFLSAASSNFTSFTFGTGAYDVNMKALSGTRTIVDDIFIPYNQLLLDPNQIESITVLTDALDKAKMGPGASFGTVCIKTKKGGYDTPLKLGFDVEAGLNMVDRVPEWVSGAEYATLNNAARTASGYSTLYTDDMIEQYKLYNRNDLFNPCVNYRSLMMKDAFMAERFGFTATAGNKNIKYSVALNAMHSGDIKTGGTNDYNKLNLVANVGTRIGRYVEASVGFQGLLSFRTYNKVSWYAWRSVPENAYPLVIEDESVEQSDRVNYGVSKTWPDNYYAKMQEGGFSTVRNRSAMFYANLDVDWSFLLKGLKSKTMIQTSNFLSTTIGKDNDYMAYYWDPYLGVQELSEHKGVIATSRSTTSTSTSQILSLYHRFFYNWQKNGHNIDAGLAYYMYSGANSGNSDRQRQQYFIGDVSWNYKNRYSVEFVAQEAGSYRYKGASRWAFFPSAGLGWTISNESWMKGVRFIDNLKIHAQAGMLGDADIFSSNYLYQANYSLTSGMTYGPTSLSGAQWFGSNTHTSAYTTVNRLANESLTWPRLNEIDLGIDLDILGCLSIRPSVWTWKRTGIITDIMSVLPSLYGLGDVSVYGNYNEETAAGYDVNLTYHKRWGDFGLTAGVDIFNWDKKYAKLANDTYSEEYQKLTGTSTNAIWGLECIGKYQSQEEIESLPSYVATSQLAIGDLKYRDVNGDGKIDTNDRIILGNYNPALRYSVKLGFFWKDLDLQIVGTGRAGGYLAMTSEYFWNGWGDGNYSAFVRDNIGGEYPNLTYDKSTNNFVLSNFWLRDGSWFKIQSAEIGYNLRLRQKKENSISGIRFSIKGENLCTFTKVKYVDPEATSSGVSTYPLLRLITLGAKFNF